MTEIKTNETDSNINKSASIHTLESDLASVVMDKNYGKNIIKIVTDPTKNSTFSDSTDKEVDGIKNKIFSIKNIILILSILFILSLGFAGYTLYKSKNINNSNQSQDPIVSTSTENSVNSLIKYNDILKPEIIQSSNFADLNRNEIITEINKIKKILLDNKVTPNTGVGINTNLTVTQLFEKIRYSGGESLLRSFGDVYTLGLFVNEKGEFETYLLVEVNDFDLAFKSILDWERYIPIDFKDIFIGNNEIINSNVNSSSTSTTTEKKYSKGDTGKFIDKILKNNDIREYVSNKDNINIIYGFVNNKFLLLTSGDSSFLDIKNRLLKENISR